MWIIFFSLKRALILSVLCIALHTQVYNKFNAKKEGKKNSDIK